MARNLGLDGVVEHFTLIGDELELLRNKSGATRLGFAVLLKFLLWHGRFPRALRELPDDAVAHLARQVRVAAGELSAFDLASRTAKRHRTEIRAYTGFRECRVSDADTLTAWLTEHVAGVERRHDRVHEQLLARCRAQLIEPPTPDRLTEIVRSALYQAEQALLALVGDRVAAAAAKRVQALIAVGDDEHDDGEDVLGMIKAPPGNVSLDTMLVEISKLEAIRAIGLPGDLFAGLVPKIVAGWRARAMVESPSHLREHPRPTQLALLCALLVLREREVTDTLAQLLISTIQQDPRELMSERGQLIALAGGLAALVIDAAPCAPIAEAQQLVELFEQLVAALDHQRVQQHEHERVAARGLQTPQLLGGHPPAECLQRSAARRRQRADVDLHRAERDEPAVLLYLGEQLLDSGPRGAPAQVRHAAVA